MEVKRAILKVKNQHHLSLKQIQDWKMLLFAKLFSRPTDEHFDLRVWNKNFFSRSFYKWRHVHSSDPIVTTIIVIIDTRGTMLNRKKNYRNKKRKNKWKPEYEDETKYVELKRKILISCFIINFDE